MGVTPGAPYTPYVYARGVRLAGSHQQAAQAHHAGVLHPLVATAVTTGEGPGGHKAKFAPCETPPGRTGLVEQLVFLYIYIGGVSLHHHHHHYYQTGVESQEVV